MSDLPSVPNIVRALTDETRAMLFALDAGKVHELPFRLQVRMALSRGNIWHRITTPPTAWAVRQQPWPISALGREIIAELREQTLRAA